MEKLIDDYAGAVLFLILFAIPATALFLSTYYSKYKYKTLRLPTKHQYSIKYPTNKKANRFIMRFRKITILLPKELPNMYLDCRVEKDTQRKAILIDPRQQIELEGDFYKSYTLFATEEARVLALEIFTPNVMESLLNAKLYCDIEIKNKKMIFLSMRSDINDLSEFINIVTPLIMNIDHKMSTWTNRNQQESKKTRLIKSNASQIRIGAKYYDLRHISTLVSTVIFAITAVLVTVLIPDQSSQSLIYLFGASLYISMIAFIYFIDRL